MIYEVETYTPWKQLITAIATGRAPQEISIRGSLSLAHLRIRSLPPTMSVSGDLDLRRCQRLSYLGRKLRVGGNLWIGGNAESIPSFQQQLKVDEEAPAFLRKLCSEGEIPIHVLPDELEVGGDLIIRGATFLRALPKNIKLGGNLYLQGCRELKRLPDALSVIPELTLIGCPSLNRLPDNLMVEKLSIKGCGIEKLPSNLDAQELIHIESCSQFTTMPESLPCLTTGKLKRFVIENSPITKLPAFISVTELLRLARVPIEILKDTFLSAKSIYITKCKNLKWCGAQLNLYSRLSFADCKKLEGFFPPTIGIQSLNLSNCVSVQSVPQELQFDPSKTSQMDLTNCEKLTDLPDIKFHGYLTVTNSGLVRLPPLMSKCRIRWRNHWITPDVIFYPERLTPVRILSEANAEIRRLMLEKIGIEKVLTAAEATIIDADRDAGGPRSLVQVRFRLPVPGRNNSSDARFLRCCCPSTGREYLLPVPPNIGNCHAAAAWLAGFNNPDDYQPIQET